MLTGSAGLLAEALRMGADGGILAAALFAPALSLEVLDRSARPATSARADAAQAKLAPLGARIVGAMGVPGVKAALDLIGLRGGEPRLPLLPLDSTLLGEAAGAAGAGAGLAPRDERAAPAQQVARATSPRWRSEPRPAGSEAEERARRYAEQVLASAGFTTCRETVHLLRLSRAATALRSAARSAQRQCSRQRGSGLSRDRRRRIALIALVAGLLGTGSPLRAHAR